MPFPVLHEDNHLLAVNKPPGLLTQPSGRDADSLEAQAKEYVRTKYAKPGAVFLHAAHRLDAPVSGIVIFARTDKALSRLQESIRERDVEKVYHAVTAARPPADEGRLEHPLLHGDRHAEVVAPDHAGAQLATLSYHLLGRAGPGWLVEIHLETGRYHQIRAQLAAAGCPVVGDTAYGGPRLPGYPGILLHHRHMVVPHPTLKTPLALDAPYPPTWPKTVPVRS